MLNDGWGGEGITYPRIVDAGDRGLRLIQDKEGSQVGSVRGDNNHSETSPYHAEYSSTKALRGA